MWCEIYDRDVEAMPTQSPLWVDYSSPRPAGSAMRAGSTRCPAGHSPYCRWFARFSWRHRDSMPVSWGYGGLIVTQDGVHEALASAVLRDLSTAGMPRLHLRPNPLQAPVWAAVANGHGVTPLPSRAHILDLDGGFDVVWRSRFKSALRREVRRHGGGWRRSRNRLHGKACAGVLRAAAAVLRPMGDTSA